MSSKDSSQHEENIEGIRIITSNELRLSIVKTLHENGPLNIGSLASSLKKSRQLIKHHISILEASGIVAQKSYGSLKVYELTNFGMNLMTITQDDALKKRSREGLRFRKIYFIGMLVISSIPLVFATIRFILQKSHPLWVLGGALTSLVAYYALNKILKK